MSGQKNSGIGLVIAAVAVGAGIMLIPRKTGKQGMGKTGTTESERLAALRPEVRDALARLRVKLAAKGIKILIGQTRRSLAEEKENFAKGASATMNSWHLLGRAVDVYPYDPATGKPDMMGKNTALFKLMHDEAAKEGFRNISFNNDGTRKYITVNKGKPNERKTWDGGHMEYPGGMTFAQASAKDGTRTA